MAKENTTRKRLKERIEEIKVDCKSGASLSFLSRKYGMVARATMKSFLIEEGIDVKS